MFAYLRDQDQTQTQSNLLCLSNKMRNNIRNGKSSLTNIDQTNTETIGQLAEIHMREFSYTLHILQQVNTIATRYHEYAFDNTDSYIQGEQQRQQQDSSNETPDQRNASQLLLKVGNNYNDVNMALKALECGILMGDVLDCESAKIEIVAQQFRINPLIIEDAFNRLNSITKNVWGLVDIIALSHLFRFVDEIIFIPPEDGIFIPRKRI